MPKITYQGPELNVELQTQESMPPRHTLIVSAHVPTGGFELTHDETRTREGRTEVLLRLESPGPGEMVTQAFETKTASVRRGDVPLPVHVLVAQPQRNVHYVQAPPHELAKVVPAPKSGY
jgi:hypothetical protein